jgi:hypothetical protein
MTLTVEQLLAGTNYGRPQTVGNMQIIPLLGDNDDTFAPPDVATSSPDYGQVKLYNDSDRPTILPHGATWIVKSAVQDHAIPSGALIKANSSKSISTAMCVESSQAGHIKKDKYELQILPAELRAQALGVRTDEGYDKLWKAITQFNTSYGVEGEAHLNYFLKQFEKELDEFVAQFEIVPGQIGALVLLDGKVVGVERAPSSQFWEAVWRPLIRICYGSLAIKLAKKLGNKIPSTRTPLDVKDASLNGIVAAIQTAREKEADLIDRVIGPTLDSNLIEAEQEDDSLGKKTVLSTVANQNLAGQIVTVSGWRGKDKQIKYASLSIAKV